MNRFLTHGLATGIAGVMLLLATPLASAYDRVNWSVNIGVPAVGYPVYAAPVYSQPQVVYQQPQRVYVEPAPVYYAPAPVYVRPAPLYGPVVYYDTYPQRRYWNHGHHGYGRDQHYYNGR